MIFFFWKGKLNFMGVPEIMAKGLCSRIFRLSPISAVIGNFLCQWLDVFSEEDCVADG